MNPSSHSFTCGMITTTGAIMDFIFNNHIGGWMLVGVSVIIFTIAAVIYKKERGNKK